MSQSSVKQKRIFSILSDVSVPDRVTYLENNEYKVLYFQAISASTGTITAPAQSTILLDQFYEGGDAIVETINNGQPTGQSPLTTGGAVVSVTSFDTAGNYSLSGTPVSSPVALIYILKIKGKDYQNLNVNNILSMTTTETTPEVQWLSFDNTPILVPDSPGVMSWDDTAGTASLQLKGSNVILPIGQLQVARVVNKATVDLLQANYQVVKVTGATGQRLSVDLAQGNNDPNSVDTLGIVAETILKNQEGFIVTLGQLTEINTTGSLQGETWADGDVIYLSPFVAGGMTKVKPVAPNHGVSLGYVEYAHANHGKLFIKIQNGYELDELHNVYAPSPNDGDTIKWVAANSRYENTPLISTGYTITTSNASFNPADLTTLYMGGSFATAPATADNTFRFVYPKSGTIKAIGVSHRIVTTLGTSENSSLGIGVNGVYTDFTTTYTLDINTRQTLYSGLSVAVTAGNYGVIRLVTPNFVTNPVGVLFTFTIYIE